MQDGKRDKELVLYGSTENVYMFGPLETYDFAGDSDYSDCPQSSAYMLAHNFKKIMLRLQ